ALHRATPARLAAAADEWRPRFAHLPRPLVAGLVGGTNGRVRLGAPGAAGLAGELAAMGRGGRGGARATPPRGGAAPGGPGVARGGRREGGGWVLMCGMERAQIRIWACWASGMRSSSGGTACRWYPRG